MPSYKKFSVLDNCRRRTMFTWEQKLVVGGKPCFVVLLVTFAGCAEFYTYMSSSEISSGGRKRKYRPDRLEYLDQLMVEFQNTRSKDAREQVLANLANFAFDPLNYKHFRQLKILDVFIDNLSNKEENLIKFSIGGLCNSCLDPLNKDYINENGLKKIIKLLEHSNEDILLSTMTTLMFLSTPDFKAEIASSTVIKSMLKISLERNTRLRHLALIFLKDYCSKEQIKQNSVTDNLSEIPIPED